MYKKNIFPILKSLKKTKNVMIIFHGYGSNGNQIINIAKYWQAFLPNTIFIAPNGLKSCYNNKYGHKWFNIENYNLKYKNLYNKNYKIYITKIKIYINYILYKYKLLTLKLFFSGFSQGAILALRLGLEYKNNLGIISYSGAFIHEKKFKPKVKIPIILIHGKKDIIGVMGGKPIHS